MTKKLNQPAYQTIDKEAREMQPEEKLGYVMLGYEKAIVALMDLDYKSEPIQKLIKLIYMLQCNNPIGESDTPIVRQNFTKKHLKLMKENEEDYLTMFDQAEYEYLLNAVLHHKL